MDAVMIPVTLAAVVVAMASTLVAWRVSREDRRRSEARIAALSAALATPDAPDRRPGRAAFSATRRLASQGTPAAALNARPREVALASRVVAPPSRVVAPASVPATVSPEPAPVRSSTRQGAAARAANESRSAGASVARPQRAELPGSLHPDSEIDLDPPLRFGHVDESRGRTAAVADDMFSANQRVSNGSRFALVAGIGLLVVGSMLFFVFGRSLSDPAVPTAPAHQSDATAASAAAEEPELELVSLRHSRQGEVWTITGLVRNPAVGAELKRAAAVAFLFDKDGSFVGSGRAAIDFARLAPGEESPFVVALKATGPVERYRISFRGEDGKVLRHVDRRSNVPRS